MSTFYPELSIPCRSRGISAYDRFRPEDIGYFQDLDISIQASLFLVPVINDQDSFRAVPPRPSGRCGAEGARASAVTLMGFPVFFERCGLEAGQYAYRRSGYTMACCCLF
jgi:hypothetical protein